MGRKVTAFFVCMIAMAVALAVSGEDAASLYLKGSKHFHDGEYAQARETFEKLLSEFPSGKYAPDAVFKCGEIYYRQNEYEKAGGYFRFYMERFPLGPNLRDAKYRLIQCEKYAKRPIEAVHPHMKRERVTMKAVWVGRFYGGDLQAVDREFARLAPADVNTVIVPAFNLDNGSAHAFVDPDAPRGAYFPTDVLPVSLDVLSDLSRMAHKYGLRIAAHVPVRSLPLAHTDRNWDPVDKGFASFSKLDLFSPEAVQSLKKLVVALSKVSIDDMIFSELSIAPHEGFSEHAIQFYNEKLGASPDLPSLFVSTTKSPLGVLKYTPAEKYAEIATVKSDHIGGLLAELAKKAVATNPNLEIWVSVSVRTASQPAEGLLWESSDLDKLSSLPISGIVTRCDWRQMARESALTANQVFDLIAQLSRNVVSAATDPSRFVLALPVEEQQTKKSLPEWEIATAVGAAKKAGDVGLAFFPLRRNFDYAKAFQAALTSMEREEQGEGH